jgi:hypothetical protein
LTIFFQIQNAKIYLGNIESQLRRLLAPTATCPDLNNSVNVRPMPPSTLGCICAWARYGPCQATGVPPAIVYAKVYPRAILGPNCASVKFPSSATQVQSSDSQSPAGTYWWNALQAADPGTTPAGAPNYLVLWSSVSGETPTISDRVVPFTGMANGGTTNCCSGSGSGSGSTGAMARELADTRRLSLTITGGIHSGTHHAHAVGSLHWSLTIGGMDYELSVNAVGQLVIQSPFGSVPTTKVRFNPFCALFPGALFMSHSDIVVTRE